MRGVVKRKLPPDAVADSGRGDAHAEPKRTLGLFPASGAHVAGKNNARKTPLRAEGGKCGTWGMKSGVTIVRVRQAVIGCFHSYFFLFVVVNSGDRLGLLFRRDSR